MQAGYTYGTYKAAKALNDKLHPLLPKVDALLESSKITVDQGRKQMMDITTLAKEILESTRNQFVKVDEVVTDAASRAKVQLERVDMVLDDTLSRAHETVAVVHSGIMRPLREINAVGAGVRAALQYLAGGGRPTPAQVSTDEEMFI
jgi:hypothetical protein